MKPTMLSTIMTQRLTLILSTSKRKMNLELEDQKGGTVSSEIGREVIRSAVLVGREELDRNIGGRRESKQINNIIFITRYQMNYLFKSLYGEAITGRTSIVHGYSSNGSFNRY